jgi:flagellar motor switch protein FliN/FliY
MSKVQTITGETLATQWIGSFKQLLGSMTSQDHSVTMRVVDSPAGAAKKDQTWTWWSQELNILSGPAVWVGGDDRAWDALGGVVLAALGIEDAGHEDCLSTAKDLAAQSTSALLQELAAGLKTEITGSDLTPSAEPGGRAIGVSVGDSDKPEAIEFRIVFDAGLIAALDKLSTPPEPQPEPASSPDQPAAPAQAPSKPLPKNLSDLRLNVQVNLGRTTLPLSSVLKLNVGSVLNLNRSLTDLAEVLINGTHIASGQVVVCNGGYAVEITSKGPR